MPDRILELASFGQVVEQFRITTIWLTADWFHQVVEHSPQALSGVRQVLAGGDVLSSEHVQRMLSYLDAGRLINGYGPTEGTTFTCSYAMTQANHLESEVPIGKPIANTQVYVLNDALQPVPVGIAGELYIGRDGLARGYLNHPDFTAEQFIPHPYSSEAGTRLYKTGDVVRYGLDGNLMFMGRLDQQVKLRGFRIELREIETALRRHPDVRDVVAKVWHDAAGMKHLVVYVIAPGQGTEAIPAWRHFLQAKLPDYMLPTAFVVLDTFPLTLNGKVDRQALPVPDLTAATRSEALIKPRTPLEALLCGIWSELIGTAPVGIHDNFFELGGHSLLATQVISRLLELLQVELPLRHLFEAPTVAAFAAAIPGDAQARQSLDNQAELVLRLAALSEEEASEALAANLSMKVPDAQ